MRLSAHFETIFHPCDYYLNRAEFPLSCVSCVVQYTWDNEMRLTLYDELPITNRVLARKSNMFEILVAPHEGIVQCENIIRRLPTFELSDLVVQFEKI